MALDYDLLKMWQFADVRVRQAYTEKDAILYALSIGLGQAPFDSQQLAFVYEATLTIFPTMAAILSSVCIFTALFPLGAR
jgi:hypothetical protein